MERTLSSLAEAFRQSFPFLAPFQDGNLDSFYQDGPLPVRPTTHSLFLPVCAATRSSMQPAALGSSHAGYFSLKRTTPAISSYYHRSSLDISAAFNNKRFRPLPWRTYRKLCAKQEDKKKNRDEATWKRLRYSLRRLE